MKLHEVIIIEKGVTVMRVPGGWICNNYGIDRGAPSTSCFVRWDNEFQESDISSPYK